MPERSSSELSPAEVAAIQLRLLDTFRGMCAEKGLTYFAYYGTLLGCARHAGFIPWDDDIDLAVPRADYQRLLDLDWRAVGAELVSWRSTPAYPFPYFKLCDPDTVLIENMQEPYTGWGGVNIDIWPLDRVPANPVVRALNDRAVRGLRWIVLAKSIGRRPGRAWWKQALLDLTALLSRPVPMQLVLGSLEKLIARPEGSGPIGCRVGGIGPEQWMQPEWFAPASVLGFEGRELNVPHDYDRILRAVYGDYRQLPPEGKRVSTHSFRAYRLT